MDLARNEWLDRRTQAIGASEMSALFGLSPYLSEYKLWCRKRGLVPDDADNEFMEAGRRLEPVIAEWYADRTGRVIIDHGRHDWRLHSSAPMGCTLDREIVAVDERGPGCLECKNAIEWAGDEWADGPPLMHQVQIQCQMAVTGWRWGSIAVLIGGHAFKHYDVERNDVFIAAAEVKAREFWRRVETGDAPDPDASKATLEALKARWPADDGETVTLPAESMEWDAVEAQASEEIKRWEGVKTGARAQIQNAIGPALWGVTPDGVRWKWATNKNGSRTLTRSKVK